MGDPLLKRGDWRAAVAYWRSSTEPCARCGEPIDRRPGRRGPWSLDVGHIVSRAHARELGWTETQMNALTNTQPEHQRCNRKHGSALGHQRRHAYVQRRPLTSEPW